MNKMKTGLTEGLSERRVASDRIANVIVVYENDQTRSWAEKVYSRSLASQGKEPVRSTWWRLGDFAQPGVLAGAVSTAMRADLVIVSVASGGGLPLPFYIWAASWVSNRRVVGGQLVALIGTRNENEYRLNHQVRDYLRALAQNAQLAFRLEERNLPVANGHSAPAPVRSNGSRVHFRPINGTRCPAAVFA